MNGRSVIFFGAFCCALLLVGCGQAIYADAGDSAPPDQGPRDLAPDTPARCVTHCDCLQGMFCHDGRCALDPANPVYCCSGAGCPPGRWCVDAAGKRAVCPASQTYQCTNACDCGPAHCCKGGRCVKDVEDPWRPGGATKAAGCVQGVDATYCCGRASCHAGRHAYFAAASASFRCHDEATGRGGAFCTGSSCFGTACHCKPGQVCADIISGAPAGRACLLLHGGTCVKATLAGSVLGYAAADLLPCCGDCTNRGGRCDAGWRSDGRFAYARVEGVCGDGCGDGKCAGTETASTCPADCRVCGDGVCIPAEVGVCAADCACGDNVCAPPAESPRTCPADCPGACGDGWCTGAEDARSCAKDCGACADAHLFSGHYRICGDGICGGSGCADAENCLTCRRDCGPCSGGWEVMRRVPRWTDRTLLALWGSGPAHVLAAGGWGQVLQKSGRRWSPRPSFTQVWLQGLWGASATSVFAVGDHGTAARHDGHSWIPLATGILNNLRGVWGSSSSDVYACGLAGAVVRFDGAAFSTVDAKTQAALLAVWGSSHSDVYLVGAEGTVRHLVGGAWKSMPANTSNDLRGVWGSSATDVYLVGSAGTLRRCDGKTCANITSPATGDLNAVWGASASQVFVVGDGGKVLRLGAGSAPVFQGSATSADLYAVWGSSATDVWAAGATGTLVRFDGQRWRRVRSGKGRYLWDVWGGAATSVHAVGLGATVLVHDGQAWTSQQPSRPVSLTGVWGISANNVVAVGDDSTIILSTGSTWSNFYFGLGLPLADVWGSSILDVYAVGTGMIPHWDGLNLTFSFVLTEASKLIPGVPPVKVPLPLFDVWGSSSSDVYAVGWKTVLRGAGGNWSAPKYISTQLLLGIWGSAATDVYIVGSAGTVLHSTGDGKWIPRHPGTKADLTGVWGHSASDVLVAGRGGLLLRHDGKKHWSPVRLDLREASFEAYVCPDFTCVWGDPWGQLYVVGDQGVVLRHKR